MGCGLQEPHPSGLQPPGTIAARQPFWSRMARVSGHARLQLPRRGDRETQLLAHTAREWGSERCGYVESVFPISPFLPPSGGLANAEKWVTAPTAGRGAGGRGGMRRVSVCWRVYRPECPQEGACAVGSAEARREGSSPPWPEGGLSAHR